MSRLVIAVAALLLFVAVPTFGQAPAANPLPPLQSSLSPGDVRQTPEMWFYEQQRRDYLDPRVAIRQRAEFQAQQRQRRIAARKWFGLSNARPTVSTDPFHGDFSPRWSSNNPAFPYRWNGTGAPSVAWRSPYYPLRNY